MNIPHMYCNPSQHQHPCAEVIIGQTAERTIHLPLCKLKVYDAMPIIGHPYLFLNEGWDVAQAVKHTAVKVWVLLHGGSTMHGGNICSLGYFLFQPVVHNWSIKGLCCLVCGKVHIKRSLSAYRKEQPMCRQQVSSKEICHNDQMLDAQQPMI